MKPLKILIEAELSPGGHAGGIEQFAVGLVYALGLLDDGPEQYFVIGPQGHSKWFEPYLGPNQRIVPRVYPERQPGRFDRAKAFLGPLRRPAGKLRRWARRLGSGLEGSSADGLPESNGFYESLGADLIHFPFQRFVRSNLPAIYHPWDLQHLHFPNFFSPKEFGERERLYRAGCLQAQAVAAPSYAVKRDLVRRYGLDSQKIYVIRQAAPTVFYQAVTTADSNAVKARYGLPEQFALYPAQTWRHKNHLRLFEAFRLVRDRHALRLAVVCTGRKNEFWPTLEKRMAELGLQEQVRFLDYIDSTELRVLYHLCQFLVFPSLFEGGAFPVLEAFQEGAPVVCSAIAPLGEYGGEAVLQFDPTSVESIADALVRMSRDAELRAILKARGAARICLFRWDQIGRTYRALYRKVAGQALSKEDLHLLSTGGMGEPELEGSPAFALPHGVNHFAKGEEN
jgi:glycosyltransferase involved in cell wall biosynthesis